MKGRADSPSIPRSLGDHEERVRKLEFALAQGFIRYDFENVGDWLDVAAREYIYFHTNNGDDPAGTFTINTSDIDVSQPRVDPNDITIYDGTSLIQFGVSGLQRVLSLGQDVTNIVISEDNIGMQADTYGLLLVTPLGAIGTKFEIAVPGLFDPVFEVPSDGGFTSRFRTSSGEILVEDSSANQVLRWDDDHFDLEVHGPGGTVLTIGTYGGEINIFTDNDNISVNAGQSFNVNALAGIDVSAVIGLTLNSGATMGLTSDGDMTLFSQNGDMIHQVAAGRVFEIRDSSGNPKIRWTEGTNDLHIPAGGAVIASL